jgi:glycosyltransferase involved in cell wall biosynthesis
MKVLLLTRYARLGASSRVRFLQYLPYLEAKGWQVDVSPLFSGRYLHALYGGQSRMVEVIAGYWRRLQALVRAKRYDLIWIEKEAFPFLPVLAERLLFSVGVPYVVDYDDALFHRYDRHSNLLVRSLLGRKIDAVMRNAALVVAGNGYLAARARAAEARQVEIIATVVDLTRYKVVQSNSKHPLIVGWVGSPATSLYLRAMALVFESLARKQDMRFVALGATEEVVRGLPIEVWPWTEETEVQSIQAFDIGIMPLVDSPWERGKCGYKLIQYMACGKPVIASPVGENIKIVEHGVNGFLADSNEDWLASIRVLKADLSLRKKMGKAGREKVQKEYCLQNSAPKLISLFNKIKGVVS